MAAVTDVRSAAEAHHDKEQCPEEQERNKAAHAQYLANRDYLKVCSRRGPNPLRRTPHGLRALTQYDSAGGHLTTLRYCPPGWAQRSLVRKQGGRLTSGRPQRNHSWHRRLDAEVHRIDDDEWEVL